MQLDIHTVTSLLAAFAATTIGSFAIAVLADLVVAVVLAIAKPTNSLTGPFDFHKLPSFLESQFGTKQAAALAGLVLSAAVTAAGAALVHGGLTSEALQGIAAAALAAATAGAGMKLASVLRDVAAKIQALAS